MAERTMTDATASALQGALSLARDNGHSLCEPLHLAAVLFSKDDSIGARVVAKCDIGTNGNKLVDINLIRRSLQRQILKKPSQTPPPLEASPSSSLTQLIQRATSAAKSNGDALVALDHILIALYDDKLVRAELEEAGLSKSKASKVLEDMRGGRKVTSTSAEQNYEALDKYGIDLIKAVDDGKLDPVIGRDEEIRRVIQILCRRTKNNPCLVGEVSIYCG